jgi:hypothetical protein
MRRDKPLLTFLAAALLALPALTSCEGIPPINKGKKQSGKASGKAGAVAATGPQRIVCDKPLHKYGTVSQGKKIEHIFVVRNAGGAPLTVKRASGG